MSANTLTELILLIDAELKTLDPKLDKVDSYQDMNTAFARIRKLKYAREVIAELQQIIKKN